jgi:hypothetical protein
MSPPGGGFRGCELPAPISWGSERRGDASDARCHPVTGPGNLLVAAPTSRSLGRDSLRAGLALAGLVAPRAFHGFDLCSIMGQLVCRTPSPRGLRRPFDRRVPGAPFRERDDQRSRPDRWPHPSLRLCSSLGLAAFLACSAKMPRIRFYNRRFTSRAPATDITFGDCPPNRRGETRQHSASRPTTDSAASPPFLPRTAPDHLAVIQPPTATCLTARRRLRADRLPTFALARSGRASRAPQLSRLQATPPDRTL